MSLRIYYDGQCPLCSTEIGQLKALDVDGRLEFADLNDENFMHDYPHIDPQQAQRILHGETGDGTIVTGLDVTCMAWRSVGKHRWLAILRWPVIRPIADICYLFFARHRQKISRLLMGQAIEKPFSEKPSGEKPSMEKSSGQTSCSTTSCRQCR
jgi:predicted DCC family thiol-disulfide oxidoreductase YuxK